MTLRKGPLGSEKKVQLDQIIFWTFSQNRQKRAGRKNDLNTNAAGKS